MAIDMGSVAALTASLQAAVEITKGLVGLRDTTVVQDKVIELQNAILSAQSSALTAQSDQVTLLDRVRELEAQMAQMEAFDAEKSKYQLQQVDSGALAYVLKPEADTGEPPHWLCVACFQRGRKSLLQMHGRDPADRSSTLFRCPECTTDIRVYYEVAPDRPAG